MIRIAFIPTVVGVANYIYLFAVNQAGELSFNRAPIGEKFEGWKNVDGYGHTSYAITAGTAGAAKYIFLEMKERDGKIYLNQGFDRFQDLWALISGESAVSGR